MTNQKIKIAILSLVAIIAFIGALNALMIPTESLTEDYALFRKLSEIASTADQTEALQAIRTELANRKLDFKIEDNKLTILAHPNVQFDILNDGKLLSSSNPAMTACQILDSEDLTKVVISGNAQKGEFYEVIKFAENKIIYKKTKGEYTATAKTNWLLVCSLGIITIASASTAIIMATIPKKKKAPQTPTSKNP